MRKTSSAKVTWVNVLLGIWLCLSPFVLGFSQNTVELWNNLGIGIAAVLIALLASRAHGAIGALSVPLAIWLFVSPFILGYSRRDFLVNNVMLAFFLIAGAAITDAVLRPVDSSLLHRSVG